MMDENPKKKGTDGMVAPKKRMSVVFRDTANTRNRNDQICSRVGCSSTANPPKVAQVRPSEKGKSSRPSMQSTSSGKEVIGSSRRTATNPAKPLVKPRRTLTSSGLQADKEGKESTNVTLTEVRKSSGVSNLSSQRNFNQRPGTGFSQRENESIRPAKQAVSSSKYGLRNLRCNTISDIIPSSCSSSDSTLNRKKAMVKKINTGGESSSTVKGKMTGSSLEGLNSGSRNGIFISEARGSKNIPPRRDNSRTTVRPERSISRYARGGLSSQGNENLTETNEPRVQLPSSPKKRRKMGALLSRLTVIKNNTKFRLEIRQCSKLDNEGIWSNPVYVEPRSHSSVRSRMFIIHWSDTSIPRFIKFYCDGDCFEILTPQDFITNRKFIVEMNDQKNIPYVTRIKDTQPIICIA
ncbi:uncharacterized protein LOC123893640 [Trifolium pratense]|uniref:uncharacterized protein LOC123893640 n=1 Tax=Trifolium pratense TaxID=57577 RepID=UPI001E69333A|nr:uncharacterized protein LOC123893640 [Trifolium pratense]